MLGAALHVQALVAQEVGVVREAFDAVPAAEGPPLILPVSGAAMPGQVFGPLEHLPAVTALDTQPRSALCQQCIGVWTSARRPCRALLAVPQRQVHPPVAEQVRVEAEALPAGAALERFLGLMGLQVPVQVLAVTEQLPAHRALVQLLLPAAAQVADKVDPPAEGLPAVRAHIGLPRGLHPVPHRSALWRGGDAVLRLHRAPPLVSTVGTQLGVLVPRAGEDDLDGHLFIHTVRGGQCVISGCRKESDV